MRISDWSSDVCSSDLVGVFLGLGNAKLALAGRGHHLAEGPGQVFRREKGGQEGVELGRVFHHSQRAGERRALLPLEDVEDRIEQGGEDLAGTVGAEVDRKSVV